ncbi:hypothetical protein BDV97DRAFT_300568 [Delphinella strobiligena]|nr:hypothetical protein BDV97DRAFT_300568 [Delphinella strobiligena]
MCYKVFKIYEISLDPDPHRGHHAIFVEEDSKTGIGRVFQVTGNVKQGMTYESKPWPKPEDYPAFRHKELLGLVSTTSFSKIGEVCAAIPPPEKQYEGRKKLRPEKPLWNCQDWTTDAVAALIAAGVLTEAA